MSNLHVLTKGKHQFRFHTMSDRRVVIHTSTGAQRIVTRDRAAEMWATLRDNHGFAVK